MSLNNFNAEELQTLLSQDIEACERLIALLGDEREALKNRDHKALETVIRAKAEQLSHLENSARTRGLWAQSVNRSANSDQVWQQIIADQAPDVAESWARLKELLDVCRTENEINGKVLSRNQKTFNRLLSILRGQTASTNLYTSKGGKNASMPGHRLGEA